MTLSTYATGPISSTLSSILTNLVPESNRPIYLVKKTVENEYEYEESDERIMKGQQASNKLEKEYRFIAPNIAALNGQLHPYSNKSIMIVSLEGIMGSGKGELLDMLPLCASWNKINVPTKFISKAPMDLCEQISPGILINVLKRPRQYGPQFIRTMIAAHVQSMQQWPDTGIVVCEGSIATSIMVHIKHLLNRGKLDPSEALQLIKEARTATATWPWTYIWVDCPVANCLKRIHAQTDKYLKAGSGINIYERDLTVVKAVSEKYQNHMHIYYNDWFRNDFRMVRLATQNNNTNPAANDIIHTIDREWRLLYEVGGLRQPPFVGTVNGR
jgi:thymidylate kinase